MDSWDEFTDPHVLRSQNSKRHVFCAAHLLNSSNQFPSLTPALKGHKDLVNQVPIRFQEQERHVRGSGPYYSEPPVRLRLGTNRLRLGERLRRRKLAPRKEAPCCKKPWQVTALCWVGHIHRVHIMIIVTYRVGTTHLSTSNYI